jgi:Tfp pilus assembly protein PilN
MFKIDLLNGAGLPPRSHPLRIAAQTLAFLAVAVAVAFDGVHSYDLTRQRAAQRQTLARYDRQIADLGGVAKMLETADKKSTQIKATMAEVTQVAGTHTAWSPILVALTAQTPNEVVLSEIVAKHEEQKGEKTKGQYDDSLMLGVLSPDGAPPVEQFIRALRSALPLRSGPDSVQIVSQRHQDLSGLDAQYYVIECKLK